LEHGNEEQLARQYQHIAKMRVEVVPLQESIRGLLLMKDKIIDFIDDQAIERDWLELYAEEQFERRVGHLFDLVVIHLAGGYEMEWRHAAKPAA
jgi:hypothetical protein